MDRLIGPVSLPKKNYACSHLGNKYIVVIRDNRSSRNPLLLQWEIRVRGSARYHNYHLKPSPLVAELNARNGKHYSWTAKNTKGCKEIYLLSHCSSFLSRLIFNKTILLKECVLTKHMLKFWSFWKPAQQNGTVIETILLQSVCQVKMTGSKIGLF